jgi:hypothetical protein
MWKYFEVDHLISEKSTRTEIIITGLFSEYTHTFHEFVIFIFLGDLNILLQSVPSKLHTVFKQK